MAHWKRRKCQRAHPSAFHSALTISVRSYRACVIPSLHHKLWSVHLMLSKSLLSFSSHTHNALLLGHFGAPSRLRACLYRSETDEQMRCFSKLGKHCLLQILQIFEMKAASVNLMQGKTDLALAICSSILISGRI